METHEEYTDEYEKKAVELIKKLTQKKYRKNAIVFREAAHQIRNSANPEAQEIYDFMFGMSKQQEAKAEKDSHKAVKLFDEAIEYLGRCNWDDKISNEYIETKILKLLKEIEINKKNPSRLRDLFFEIATEERKRGNEKAHNVYLALYHFHYSLCNYPRNPVRTLKELDLSVESFKKSGKVQFKHKILGVKYRLLAYFQPTYESTRSLLDKAAKEFKKTDDRFGLDEVNGSICYTSALSERNPIKKVVLFKDASEWFRRCKLFSKYHDAIGWSYLWAIHEPSLSLEECIARAKKAQGHFKKANAPVGFHHSSGFIFMMKAIKEGIVQNKKGKFVENLTAANHHFAKCGQGRYANLTAGTILLIKASQLPDDKSKELLKKSAEIFKTINEEIYHLALYRYYRIEAYDHIEVDEFRANCEEAAVMHIEAWLSSLKGNQDDKRLLSFGIDANSIETFFRAEAYALKGRIEQKPSLRTKYLNTAIAQYDEIISANFLPSRAWQAKGWAFMFLFEFDKAHDAFSRAYELDSKNKNIMKDVQFATDQLKKGFHDLKQMYREESRFSRKLQKLLTGQLSQTSNLLITGDQGQPGQEFYQIALSYIQKAGLAIEENYPGHTDKDEEGLRDEMIQCLKMFDINVSAESKKAKGKRDIAIKDDFTDKELTAECLMWRGDKYYESKKKQLFDRYLTWHNREAVLVTFIRHEDFIRILRKAEKSITTLSNIIQGSFQDFSSEGHKLYVSEHKHVSGVTIRLYHVFFHLPT